MLVHFAATLEYNDRKVHIIKLLKVEKEPYFIHHSASHNSWSIWENSRERTCLTEVTKRQEADGRTGWKEGVIPNSVNLLMCVRPRHQNSGRFFLVELRPADLTLSFTLSPSETAIGFQFKLWLFGQYASRRAGTSIESFSSHLSLTEIPNSPDEVRNRYQYW